MKYLKYWYIAVIIILLGCICILRAGQIEISKSSNISKRLNSIVNYRVSKKTNIIKTVDTKITKSDGTIEEHGIKEITTEEMLAWLKSYNTETTHEEVKEISKPVNPEHLIYVEYMKTLDFNFGERFSVGAKLRIESGVFLGYNFIKYDNLEIHWVKLSAGLF